MLILGTWEQGSKKGNMGTSHIQNLHKKEYWILQIYDSFAKNLARLFSLYVVLSSTSWPNSNLVRNVKYPWICDQVSLVQSYSLPPHSRDSRPKKKRQEAWHNIDRLRRVTTFVKQVKKNLFLFLFFLAGGNK